MGGDLAKCVCVPDTRSADSNMDSRKKLHGEKSIDSDSESESYSSSGSGSEATTGVDTTSSASESEESSSSHREKRKRKRKSPKKKGKGKSKKNQKTHKKHRPSKQTRQYHSTSESKTESESESESTRSSSTYDDDIDDDTIRIHSSPEDDYDVHYAHDMLSNSTKLLLQKQRKQQEARESRKLALIKLQKEKKQLLQLKESESEPDLHLFHNVDDVKESPRIGRHPRIPSMSHMDSAAIQLLTETDFMSLHNSTDQQHQPHQHQPHQHQSRFDPNYSISAEPQIPNPEQQYYNNSNYGHVYSQSGRFPHTQSVPFPSRSTSTNDIHFNTNNRRRLQLRAAHSNPITTFSSGSAHSSPLDNLSRISIVDDIGVNETDDLPAMPRHHYTKNCVFDISRAGIGTLFQENSGGPDIVDNISNVSNTTFNTSTADNVISPKQHNDNNNATQNEININNLNNFFIHNELNPYAVAMSPPVDATYKPIPTTAVLTTLSKISESTHPTTTASRNTSNTSNTNNNTSNESNLTNLSSNYNPQNYLTPAPFVHVSDDEDDDETVAREWDDLHKFNVADDNLMPATDIDTGLSFNTELSSDQDEVAKDIKKWKERLSEINSVHSSDAEEEDKKVSGGGIYAAVLTVPQLLRPKSLAKWKSDDLKNQVMDMQRQVDYLKQCEQENMKKTLLDLKMQQEKKYITK